MSRPPETVDGYSRIYESEYEAGDKAALMRMIVVCAISGWIIPKWAADEIHGAAGFALWGEIKSWDEIFGKPIRRKRALKWKHVDRVYFEICEAHLKREPIDDELFERIGKKGK